MGLYSFRRKRAEAAASAKPPAAPSLPLTLTREQHERIVSALAKSYEIKLGAASAPALPPGSVVLTAEQAEELRSAFDILDTQIVEALHELEPKDEWPPPVRRVFEAVRDGQAQLDVARAEVDKLKSEVAKLQADLESLTAPPAAPAAPVAGPPPAALEDAPPAKSEDKPAPDKPAKKR
jgi:hypothetical protein